MGRKGKESTVAVEKNKKTKTRSLMEILNDNLGGNKRSKVQDVEEVE